MKNQRILRNALINVSVLFALAQLLAAGTSDGVLNFSKARLVPPHPTFIAFDPPGSTFTVPSAITSKGLIIGSYIDTSGMTHGFLRRPGGSFIMIEVPDSTSTTPTSITPGGVITGWYSDTIGNPHGFIRALDGSITSFDAPPDAYILGSIYIFGGPPPSINPTGAIAGTYVAPGFVEHGFLRTPDGSFTTIDYPGAFFTEALAINPGGVIAGDFCNKVTCFQGYVRSPDGTFTVIDSKAGIPTAINPAGAITGFVLTGSGGYLRTPDGSFTVFNPPGSIYTSPFAINSVGTITGYYCDAMGCHGFVHASDGVIAAFDPPGSTFTYGVAINPSGVITGAFVDTSGVAHGFVRTP